MSISRLRTAVITICKEGLWRETIMLAFIPDRIRSIILRSHSVPASWWRWMNVLFSCQALCVHTSSFQIMAAFCLTGSKLAYYMLTRSRSSSLQDRGATRTVLRNCESLIMRRIAHYRWIVSIWNNHCLGSSTFHYCSCAHHVPCGIIYSSGHFALSGAAREFMREGKFATTLHSHSLCIKQ